VITEKREKNNIISDDDSDNDVPEYNSDDIESNDENGTDREVLAENVITGIVVDDYVLVRYENQKYPGRVIKIIDDGVEVSTMEALKSSWKWPDKPDIHVYPFQDIVKKLQILWTPWFTCF